MIPYRALLLVGSPKGPQSTSEALGTYLAGRLRDRGLQVQKIRIHSALRTEEGIQSLFEAVDRTDILILAFPLYVDSLPAPVIRTLELIADRRKSLPGGTGAGMIALVNCGFPEACHNETALEICRLFASEANLVWLGGLSLGGGGAISGKSLDRIGAMGRNARGALDLTATALAEGRTVPPEAIERMSKPLVPGWLYTLIGSIGWIRKARRSGVLMKLNDRPYRPSPVSRT
jgi:hypothetical protein